MAIVKINSLIKKYNNVTAVNKVDLTCNDGEFLVLLGPSGCGKTTLLRMIAGLERPNAGSIFIDEKNVTDLPPRTRNIAMVFQSYALYPHKTVFKNIAFPLQAQRMDKKNIVKKIEWAAKMFKIEKLLTRKPRELSGGERQRVALARAMVREPKIFLLDEPLSNLDAKLRADARKELQQLQKGIGITTLYVTHDQIEAMGMGTRIVVMSEGRIRQVGTPREVYHEPADTFVATFVGCPPMNLIKDDNVLFGFRPEVFMPSEANGTMHDDLEYFEFAVSWIEDLGSDLLIYGNIGSRFNHQHIIAKLAVNVTIPIASGKTYKFMVPREEINFFDPKTGLKIEKKKIGEKLPLRA
ncbi:MAG: ABC transporter ATP-binding protein [bacterium]